MIETRVRSTYVYGLVICKTSCNAILGDMEYTIPDTGDLRFVGQCDGEDGANKSSESSEKMASA